MILLSGTGGFVVKIKFRNYFPAKKIFNIFFQGLTYSYKFAHYIPSNERFAITPETGAVFYYRRRAERCRGNREF